MDNWALRGLRQLLLVDGDLLGFAAAHVVLQDVVPVEAMAALVALIRSENNIRWSVTLFRG